MGWALLTNEHTTYTLQRQAVRVHLSQGSAYYDTIHRCRLLHFFWGVFGWQGIQASSILRGSGGTGFAWARRRIQHPLSSISYIYLPPTNAKSAYLSCLPVSARLLSSHTQTPSSFVNTVLLKRPRSLTSTTPPLAAGKLAECSLKRYSDLTW